MIKKDKIKGIIFDLDGTLLNSLEDLTSSVNYALEKNNEPLRTIEEIKKFVGDGIEKLIERAISDEKKFKDCLQIFLNHYKKNSTNKTKPYPKIQEGLLKLKENSLKLAVLSNKLDEETKKLCEFYFPNIFDFVLGKKEEFEKKPDAKSTLFIIKKLGLTNEEVVFIGDSEVDIETAKNAKITCLSVSWGYKNKDFLLKNNASMIFDSFDKLVDFILF